MTRTEAALARLLAEHSVFHRPRKPFRLASGATSPFYFDCRRTTMLPAAMPLVGRVVYERIRGRVGAVGGLTMGADPIACATAYYSAGRRDPIPAFSVRKEPKSHGRERWIEGALPPRATVAVVEDVVTSGGSTCTAIERCREEGYRIGAVVVLVDRETGGLDTVREAAGRRVPVEAIFRRSEIDALWRARRP